MPHSSSAYLLLALCSFRCLSLSLSLSLFSLFHTSDDDLVASGPFPSEQQRNNRIGKNNVYRNKNNKTIVDEEPSIAEDRHTVFVCPAGIVPAATDSSLLRLFFWYYTRSSCSSSSIGVVVVVVASSSSRETTTDMILPSPGGREARTRVRYYYYVY